MTSFVIACTAIPISWFHCDIPRISLSRDTKAMTPDHVPVSQVGNLFVACRLHLRWIGVSLVTSLFHCHQRFIFVSSFGFTDRSIAEQYSQFISPLFSTATSTTNIIFPTTHLCRRGPSIYNANEFKVVHPNNVDDLGMNLQSADGPTLAFARGGDVASTLFTSSSSNMRPLSFERTRSCHCLCRRWLRSMIIPLSTLLAISTTITTKASYSAATIVDVNYHCA